MVKWSSVGSGVTVLGSNPGCAAHQLVYVTENFLGFSFSLFELVLYIAFLE